LVAGTGGVSPILKYQSPTLACSSIMLEEIGSAAECQSFANNNGLTWKGALPGDANWIDGCFQWYGTKGQPVGSSPNVYWNNANGATSGNIGGHKICAGATAPLDVPSTNANSNYLDVTIGAFGRYLWIARPGNSEMTICELKVKQSAAEAVDITVGGASGASGTTKDVSKCGVVCPSVVTSGNWLNAQTFPDTFAITTVEGQGKTTISAVRTDSAAGWGMTLKIRCLATACAPTPAPTTAALTSFPTTNPSKFPTTNPSLSPTLRPTTYEESHESPLAGLRIKVLRCGHPMYLYTNAVK
jgi:hypothetical protein